MRHTMVEVIGSALLWDDRALPPWGNQCVVMSIVQAMPVVGVEETYCSMDTTASCDQFSQAMLVSVDETVERAQG